MKTSGLSIGAFPAIVDAESAAELAAHAASLAREWATLAGMGNAAGAV